MKLLFLTTLFLTIIQLNAQNLLKNSEFVSRNGVYPDGWIREQSRPLDRVFTTIDGVLRISEQTPNYYNAITQTVEIDGGKGYYFEVEYKMDAQAYPAGIFYVLLDGNDKKIQPERFILNSKSSREQWTKISQVITSPDPVNTKKIKLAFVSYSKGENPDNGIYFRKPLLEEYAGQEIKKTVNTQIKASDRLPTVIFGHHLTNTPAGVPYKLEKGEVGFLRMDSNEIGRRQIRMEVQVPPEVVIEPYLHIGSEVRRVEPAVQNTGTYVFEIATNCNWSTWSNVLMFAAGPDTPNSFDIKMKLTAVKENHDWNFIVPVEQISSMKNHKLPERFSFSAWQAFPITRIDLNNPANALAIRLDNNWRRSGWKHNPELRATGRIPFRADHWNKPVINIPHGINISGAPTTLFCDSALINGGPEFFADIIRQAKYEEQVKNALQFECDYEPYTQGPITMSCFCSRCLEQFTSQHGLSSTLTGLDILKNHEKEWVQFRMRQRADFMRTVVAGFKMINPDIKFRFCSMPLPPVREKEDEYFKTYGIDMRLFEDFTDIHTPMNYSSTLDFFRSLEREAHELNKTRATIVSVGWGDVSTIIPRQRAAQLFAAFFCDNAYPVIGQGLFIAQGDMIIAIKKMMNDVADTEKYWLQGKLDHERKIKASPGFHAKDNIYFLSRSAADGRQWVYVFNNSKDYTAYIRFHPEKNGEYADLLKKKIIVSEPDGFNLEISPLEYRIIQISPKPEFTAWAKELSEDTSSREKSALAEQRKRYQQISQNGFECRMIGNEYQIKSPIQKLTVNLANSAESSWEVGGKPAASLIGRCVFMDNGAFSLGGLPANLESCDIGKDRVTAVFRHEVRQKPYDGLILLKKFTVFRNIPQITVDLIIVPEGGLRMFRCRVVNEVAVGKEIIDRENYSSRIEYKVGDHLDRGGKHITFVKAEAKLPDGKPFLSKYVSSVQSLIGGTFIAKDIISGKELVLQASGVDQLFCWRDHDSATLEIIYPDAYPHFDPHLIKTWEQSYTIQYREAK